MKKTKKRIQVCLPEDMLADLDKMAGALEISRGEMIRLGCIKVMCTHKDTDKAQKYQDISDRMINTIEGGYGT